MPAPVAPKPLRLEPQYVEVTINALAQRPWGEVNGVMQSLIGQMNTPPKPDESEPVEAAP